MTRRTDAALVAGPALLATALCLIGITGRSLGFDESASVAIASQHGAALGHGIAHDGGNMSGYYVLLHVLIGLFGNTELVLRLPSALGVGATTAIVCVLALRLFDRRTAVAAGLLTAVSLPLVFWGQSARSYALLVALCAGSFLAFVALIDGERPRRAAVAYVLCTALAMYMSLLAILIVPAQLLVLVWRRERVREVAASVVAVAVCCVPLLVLAVDRGSGQLFWVSRPNLTGEKQVLEAVTSAGLEPSIHASATTDVLLVLTIVMLLAVAVAAVRGTWRSVLVASWLLVPLVLAFVESLVGQPVFLPRNLLMVLPAASLLLAWGITRQRVPAVLSWGALAALIALRALQLVPSYGVSPEDWRGATAYVLAQSQPGDCIAFYPSDGRQAFEYYLPSRERSRAPRPVLPTTPFTEVRAFVEDYAVPSPSLLVRLPAGCPRLWFVSSHQGQPNGPAGSRANWTRYLSLNATLEREYGSETMRSFGYASPVRVVLLTRVR